VGKCRIDFSDRLMMKILSGIVRTVWIGMGKRRIDFSDRLMMKIPCGIVRVWTGAGNSI
jgi:hypothetical protein